MNRRTFLSRSSAALAGMSIVRSDTLQKRRLFAPIGQPGVQLYTVRDQMEKDVHATLTRVAEIGYKEFEFAGYFDHDPAVIRGWLDDLEVTAPGSHVGFERMRDNAATEIEAAKIVGHAYIIVPGVPDEMRESIESYKSFAAALNTFGATCADAGLKFAFHNHDYEFGQIDDTVPFDVIAGETDPELVDLEMDLFWTIKAGASPVDYFEKYPGRFTFCHVKDMAADGAMVEVGSGEIDFGAIFSYAETAGLKHFIVEHDEPDNSFESIETSYRAVAELLG